VTVGGLGDDGGLDGGVVLEDRQDVGVLPSVRAEAGNVFLVKSTGQRGHATSNLHHDRPPVSTTSFRVDLNVPTPDDDGGDTLTAPEVEAVATTTVAVAEARRAVVVRGVGAAVAQEGA